MPDHNPSGYEVASLHYDLVESMFSRAPAPQMSCDNVASISRKGVVVSITLLFFLYHLKRFYFSPSLRTFVDFQILEARQSLETGIRYPVPSSPTPSICIMPWVRLRRKVMKFSDHLNSPHSKYLELSPEAKLHPPNLVVCSLTTAVGLAFSCLTTHQARPGCLRCPDPVIVSLQWTIRIKIQLVKGLLGIVPVFNCGPYYREP